MSTALQQVERIARSPRCAVTSDAAGSSSGIVARLVLYLNLTRSEIATIRGFAVH